jgi:hypothetical protein
MNFRLELVTVPGLQVNVDDADAAHGSSANGVSRSPTCSRSRGAASASSPTPTATAGRSTSRPTRARRRSLTAGLRDASPAARDPARVGCAGERRAPRRRAGVRDVRAGRRAQREGARRPRGRRPRRRLLALLDAGQARQVPGVVVAFWRMVAVSVLWNAVLRSTGRRVTLRDVRQVFVPGIFFGLNLAVFFAGATTTAALIGSLAPFLIVPVGAWLFSENINANALGSAVLAFGGVALVLFSAPPNGDASLEGNVVAFGRRFAGRWFAVLGIAAAASCSSASTRRSTCPSSTG